MYENVIYSYTVQDGINEGDWNEAPANCTNIPVLFSRDTRAGIKNAIKKNPWMDEKGISWDITTMMARNLKSKKLQEGMIVPFTVIIPGFHGDNRMKNVKFWVTPQEGYLTVYLPSEY